MSVMLLFAATAVMKTSPSEPPEAIALPAPKTEGMVSVETALARRRSVRTFQRRGLSLAEIGQLAWAAQGKTHREGFRAAPSAGALYPLELYIALAEGLFHYEPHRHRLIRTAAKDLRLALRSACLDQAVVDEAPAVFVLAAVVERTAAKYRRRAERYVFLEAGHAAQNLLLQATALGLGGVPIGAFDDDALTRALGLGGSERAVYVIPIGAP